MFVRQCFREVVDSHGLGNGTRASTGFLGTCIVSELLSIQSEICRQKTRIVSSESSDAYFCAPFKHYRQGAWAMDTSGRSKSHSQTFQTHQDAVVCGLVVRLLHTFCRIKYVNTGGSDGSQGLVCPYAGNKYLAGVSVRSSRELLNLMIL